MKFMWFHLTAYKVFKVHIGSVLFLNSIFYNKQYGSRKHRVYIKD